MIDSLVIQSLKTCKSALEFCKSRLDPLKHKGDLFVIYQQEKLFLAVDVALEQVSYGLRIAQLALDHQLIQEAKEGNGIAQALVFRDRKKEAAGDRDE